MPDSAQVELVGLKISTHSLPAHRSSAAPISATSLIMSVDGTTSASGGGGGRDGAAGPVFAVPGVRRLRTEKPPLPSALARPYDSIKLPAQQPVATSSGAVWWALAYSEIVSSAETPNSNPQPSKEV
eukprot:3299178-Prymnesium_polylepis.2